MLKRKFKRILRNAIRDILESLICFAPIYIFVFVIFGQIFYEEYQIKKHKEDIAIEITQPATMETVLEVEEPTTAESETESIVASSTVYEMKTVAYCSCAKCCGHSTGITYSGTVATQGRTIACKKGRFPMGTVIVIDGIHYVVEDVGGGLSDNTLDIFFDNHQDALNYGVQYKIVEVITEK